MRNVGGCAFFILHTRVSGKNVDVLQSYEWNGIYKKKSYMYVFDV